jgi:hypothetical protein
VFSDEQPDTREGGSGRGGVTERPAVPLKPGNSGGGKGPQFRTDASLTDASRVFVLNVWSWEANQALPAKTGRSRDEMPSAKGPLPTCRFG